MLSALKAFPGKNILSVEDRFENDVRRGESPRRGSNDTATLGSPMDYIFSLCQSKVRGCQLVIRALSWHSRYASQTTRLLLSAPSYPFLSGSSLSQDKARRGFGLRKDQAPGHSFPAVASQASFRRQRPCPILMIVAWLPQASRLPAPSCGLGLVRTLPENILALLLGATDRNRTPAYEAPFN